MTASLAMDVRGIPELVSALRREMADMLREQAEAEASPHTAARLRALAAAFEAGQRP